MDDDKSMEIVGYDLSRDQEAVYIARVLETKNGTLKHETLTTLSAVQMGSRGYEYGYMGTGPAALAKKIVSDYYGEEATREHQTRAMDLVARMPAEGGYLPVEALGFERELVLLPAPYESGHVFASAQSMSAALRTCGYPITGVPSLVEDSSYGYIPMGDSYVVYAQEGENIVLLGASAASERDLTQYLGTGQRLDSVAEALEALMHVSPDEVRPQMHMQWDALQGKIKPLYAPIYRELDLSALDDGLNL
jgi:hypothetical protein